ncbi:MobA/MobL family protein [Citromicrobium bathyomarinum]
MQRKPSTNRQLEAAAEFEAARVRIKLIREGILEDISRSSGQTIRKIRVQRQGSLDQGRTDGIPRFDLPAARKYRFTSSQGATSFHFAHRAIPKVTYATCQDGVRVKPGAARAHGNYIERESGVAAFQTKLRECGALNGEPQTNENDRQRQARSADQQDEYVSRPAAVAIQPEGQRALLTNIDNRDDGRGEFWAEVEKNERTASPDKMAFRVLDNPEFWLRIAGEAECPEKLKQKILGPHADDERSFVIENGKKTRSFLARQTGWIRPGSAEREGQPAMARFQDGRGGRIQYRIELELPSELSPQQNFELLKEFAEEFENRRIPFVAVMHQPDEHNDPSNWHGHIIYYDRPCRRIDDRDIRDLAKKGFDTAGLVAGAWDFTVSVPTPGRNNRRTFPLRQKKVAEVSRSKAWPKTLRKRLAIITNRHLARAGEGRRVSPETFKDMGIAADPQQHLGNSNSAAETRGHVTAMGLENEARQWQGIAAEAEAELRRRLTENADRGTNSTMPASIQERLDLASHLHKHIFLLEQEMQRSESRAQMVLDRNRRLLAADRDDAEKNAKERQERLWLVDQASRYLTMLQHRLSNERALIDHWNDEALSIEHDVDRLERDEKGTVSTGQVDYSGQEPEPTRPATDAEIPNNAASKTTARPTNAPDQNTSVDPQSDRSPSIPIGFPFDQGHGR